MNDLTINVSTLKDLKSNFDNELNHFKNTSFDTFNNSYFKMCTDPYVLRMNIKLSLMYDKLKSGYRNIDKWWIDYISNVEELEKTLSNDERAGLLETADIKNYINNNLQKLDDFKMSIAGTIATQIEQNKDSVKFTNNEVVNNEDQFSDLYKDYNVNVVDIMKENIKKMFGKTSSKTTDEPKNVLNEKQQEKYDKVMDIVKTGAKMAIIASVFGSPSEKKTNQPEDIFTVFNNKVNNIKENVSDTINDIGEGAKNTFNNAKENVNEFLNDASTTFNNLAKKTAAVTSNGAKFTLEKVSTISTNVSNWAKDVVNDFKDNPIEFVLNKYNKAYATIGSVISSVSEGLLQFGEAIFDFGMILSSMQSTGAYVVSDIVGYGISLVTGNEFNSNTLKMWNSTQGFIAKEHVKSWADSWYEKNLIGKWVSNNAYGFENVRQVGSGVGYTGGVVLLTVLTAGVGGAAVGGGAAAASGGAAAAGSAATSATITSTQLAMTATAAGIGKGTEAAWADGAGIAEGLAAGTASGVWEGIQWYLGGKINSFNPVKGTGVEAKVANSLARVILDSVDGAAEGIAQPLIQTIYKDGYYDENGNYIKFESKDGILKRFNETFDDNGGASSIATNAVIGGIGSVIGEVFDLGRFLKDKKTDTNVNQTKINIDNINKENNLNIHYDEKFSSIMKQSEFNKNNLVNGILDSLPSDLDDLSKARAIYLKLNQAVTYSDEYFALDSIGGTANDMARKSYIYNQIFDIENMETNKLVCNNWSNVYKELLEKSGIDPNKIQVVGKEGNHKYVTIELDQNKILLADATNSINPLTDLVSSKYGLETHGFIITTKDAYTEMISNYNSRNTFRALGTLENQKIVNSIDENIGYSNSNYRKNFDEIVDFYSNQSNNSKVNIEQKINTFANIFDDKQSGAIESFPLMRQMAPQILGNDSQVKWYLKGNDAIVTVSVKLNELTTGYLVKINDSKLKFEMDISKIIEGATSK